jgi:hypothetical protein
MRRVKSGDRLIGTVERGRVAAWKWRTLVSEFERGWQAALEAAKAWHEGKAKQILVQAGRSRFPKSLEQQAETHRLAAEVLPTLTPEVTD